MNDCLNAELRDRLPDLLHDRLSASVRAEVNAHVAACTDCREELELLRELNAMLVKSTPRVDIAYVVNALPKPPARDTTTRVATRRTWADWRIAAAVTLLVAGGSSVAVMTRSEPSASHQVVLAPTTDTPSTTTSANTATASIAPDVTAQPVTVADAQTELGMAGHLADLDDEQLEALISEIEQMKAVPITEPEPVTVKVDPKGTQPPEVR